jgi:hypothetical protein
LAAIYDFCQPTSLGGTMENVAELMQRLLEIHSGERRSPELIEEDERLMAHLQKRSLAGKPPQTVRFSQVNSSPLE